MRRYPKRRTPCSNSVSGARSLSRSATLPNSVPVPVRTTTATALPLTTCVPMKSVFARWPRAESEATGPAVFATGYVSPVRAASSRKRLFDSSSRQSPGTFLPADRAMTSPGTSSETGTSFWAPSRSAVAFVCTTSSSLSTACEAPRSCQNPSAPLARTMTRMIRASAESWTKYESPAAKRRMRMSGLLNWPSRRATSPARLRDLRAPGPTRARRRSASALARPCEVVSSRRRTSSAGMPQKKSSGSLISKSNHNLSGGPCGRRAWPPAGTYQRRRRVSVQSSTLVSRASPA